MRESSKTTPGAEAVSTAEAGRATRDQLTRRRQPSSRAALRAAERTSGPKPRVRIAISRARVRRAVIVPKDGPRAGTKGTHAIVIGPTSKGLRSGRQTVYSLSGNWT